MQALFVQGWLMIVVTIFCGVRTYRDFAARNVRWGVISLLVTIAAVAAITIPMPTHAVKIDLPR
jgi:di/tricarboxylate transporter